MPTAYQFPFDPSGTSAANRITNEQHVITAVNFRDYHYVIPNFAPFFEESLTIKLQFPDSSQRNLVQGVDYYLSNQFLDASRACAKPIYGSISFLDTDTQGILSISYNTVGGEWNLSTAEITRILAEEMRNPRTTTWEQITYLPERFPVVDHEWDLVDMVGMSKVVNSIDDVRDAILSGNGGGLSAHINNYSNPHNVTKAQVGLSNVQNYTTATQAAAQAGTSDGFYMTPLSVSYAISALGGALVNAHANRTDNPHSTTKAQVGLGNVANYAVSTTAEAQAGAVDTSFMTPLKTAQAIAQLVGTAFTSHINNQLNPHNVTAAQVGLFNVQNFGIASQQDALNGTSNTVYMTPLRTQQQIVQYVSTQLDGHASRTDNPHQTTAAQVGLGLVNNWGIATQADAQAGVSNTLYMTPGRTADAINALAVPASHLTDYNNPHQVTADQLGAYTKVEIDTRLGAKVNISDTNWVAGMTKAAFVAEVLAGKAATAGEADDAFTLNGKTFNDIVTDVGTAIGHKFAYTTTLYSKDKILTADPVANPNRWVKVGDIKPLTIADTGLGSGIATTYPDAYWFATGGEQQAADDATQRTVSSAAYLIHAKNGLTGNLVFDVTRLNGIADTDMKFGYTFDAAGSVMHVWAKVAAGYTDLTLTQLSSAGNTINMADDSTIVEPAGIVYATPVAYATASQYSALAQRVTDIETALNSITVV
jgi:hypothetical protein